MSATYQRVEALLDAGWRGTYGDLAVAVGLAPKAGRVAGRLVKAYARRHPLWPHDRVVTKHHGRPAYM